MPMSIALVEGPAAIGTAKSLDSRHKHSGMTRILFQTLSVPSQE